MTGINSPTNLRRLSLVLKNHLFIDKFMDSALNIYIDYDKDKYDFIGMN